MKNIKNIQNIKKEENEKKSFNFVVENMILI